MFAHRLDVLYEELTRVFSRLGLLNPSGNRLVPAEGVSTNLDVIPVSEG
jgi:hypothetical protein